MRLADQIAQCRTPFIVETTGNKRLTSLMGAADFSSAVAACPTRYCLSDDLVGLCAALAYSKGARALACADLLHVPAQRLRIEWCEAPWMTELERYGFRPSAEDTNAAGRRGAFIQSSPQGRRGLIRTFWADGDNELDVLASGMESYFDFDTEDGEEPVAPDGRNRSTVSVFDSAARSADILRRCFRFRYERSWQDHYEHAQLSLAQNHSIARHALGTIAIDMPVILAFLLLLATRPGLPRRPLMLERLNRTRMKAGKTPLLDHIEVSSPLLPEYRASEGASGQDHPRRDSRLHHVREHLVRRGSQLFWRVPHLRGSGRLGVVRTRTVTWSLDSAKSSSQALMDGTRDSSGPPSGTQHAGQKRV
ncbi:MAG: hypothetical protein ABI356_08635 [Steroidobacteraceae bacterium]